MSRYRAFEVTQIATLPSSSRPVSGEAATFGLEAGLYLLSPAVDPNKAPWKNWVKLPALNSAVGNLRGQPDIRSVQRSVYLSARPRATSTGYFASFLTILRSNASARSMPVSCASSSVQ